MNLNTSKLSERPTYLIPVLVFHEGAPGHHLQIMLQRENPEISEFRRGAGLGAFSEGWALYAERLGLEVGFFEDPYDDLGRLTYEMWRACRLVIDSGVHALGWTREQSLRFMRDHNALGEIEIVAEVDRYISEPGQPLGYKIGELEITRLRQKAEQALGDRFDLRAFHDAVLRNGALPLALLREQVEGWLERELAMVEPAA
jgi:uncharacterized protein (DUF885 family)